MLKRNDWFNNYQTTIDGKKGQRDLEKRKEFFDKEDFVDKTVVDVGCNVGQMCDFAASLGATNVLGIEFDKTAVTLATQRNQNDKIQYICDDIDNYFLYTTLPDFDTIMLLSVIETQELTNRFGMLAKLSKKCNTLYLEGHVNSDYNNLLKYLLCYTDFTQIEFKGTQFDNDDFEMEKKGRSIFKCNRNIMNREESILKLLSLLRTGNRECISICGQSGSGKTFIRQKLIEAMQEDGYTFDEILKLDDNKRPEQQENNVIYIDNHRNTAIIDDVPPNSEMFSKLNANMNFVCFDYRATQYFQNIHTTIFHVQCKNYRNTNKSLDTILLRSPFDTIKNVKHIYHICPYQDDK